LVAAASLCPDLLPERSADVNWHTQNFLLRASLIDRLIAIAALDGNDVVLDLGAGRGQLTEHLARRCRRVIAVEKDPLLAMALRLRFAEYGNVIVKADDALATRLPREPYKVVANIPFDITARLIRRLTSAKYQPADAYLAVQREAAERVLGQPRETLFGLEIKPWFEPSIVHRFRRTDFSPSPRVDVVFLRLRKRGPPLISAAEAGAYRYLVSFAFTAPQPTLSRKLEPLLGRRRLMRLARELHLDRSAPPSSVALECWISLARALAADGDAQARLQLCSKVTTRRAMRRSTALRIMRPDRWPASRRHA
jgi:23S rRNA (adenine-N6)-dimethyltransferase